MVKLEEAIKSEKFESPTHKAMLNVLYCAWWLKTIISSQLKPFGITHEQYNVLRILKGKHPLQMCVRDIGCRMIEKSSNVPRIIDRLEAKKLAARSVSLVDKRETNITITNAGLGLLLEVAGKINVLEGDAPFNNDDALALNHLLEKMRR